MAVDLRKNYFDTGTASVTNGETLVTFQSFGDLFGAVLPNDKFGAHVGEGIRIDELLPGSNQVRLAWPWTGPTQTAQPYEISIRPRSIGYKHALEELIADVGEGNLPLFSALTAAADKLAYFDSPGSMATTDFPAWARSMFALTAAADKLAYLSGGSEASLTDLTAFARTLLATDDAAAALDTLGFAAFVQGLVGVEGSAAFYDALGQIPNAQIRDDLPPDKAFRRGNIIGAVSESSGVPTGALSTGWIQNANGWYKRDADGTQVCFKNDIPVGTLVAQNAPIYGLEVSWSFPVGFISAPIVYNTPNSSGYTQWGGRGINTTLTQSGIAFFSDRVREGVVGSALAIGRWY